MRHILIRRFKYLRDEILGTLIVFDNEGKVLFNCMTLELAYHNNAKNKSSVPTGDYVIQLEYSGRFKRELWELKDVPGRSECKIHNANFYRQLNGCIAVGTRHTHINGDGVPDVTDSVRTLERFHAAMGDSVTAYIDILGMA